MKTRMSQKNVNRLLDLWRSSLLDAGVNQRGPFANRKQLYATIDQIKVGDAPWHSFSVRYNGEKPEGNVPKWMTDDYPVYYRDPDHCVDIMCDNPDFHGQFDYIPFKEFDANGGRIFSNNMSGNHASEQAVWG